VRAEAFEDAHERRADLGAGGGDVVGTGDDEDDAVRIANDTIYGLAGGVWSGDPERAKRVARRLRTGQVEVNGGGFNLMAPFGGYKQSGHGRELGKYGLDEFLEIKSLQL